MHVAETNSANLLQVARGILKEEEAKSTGTRVPSTQRPSQLLNEVCFGDTPIKPGKRVKYHQVPYSFNLSLATTQSPMK